MAGGAHVSVEAATLVLRSQEHACGAAPNTRQQLDFDVGESVRLLRSDRERNEILGAEATHQMAS